jgi:hypothetical protein
MSENFRGETRSAASPATLPGELPPAMPTISEWGLASLILAGVVGVSAPPTFSLLLAADMDQWAHLHPKAAAAFTGYVVGLGVIALSLIAATFGLIGMTSGRQPGQSIALGLTGLLLGIMDAVVWFVILACWHIQATARVQ